MESGEDSVRAINAAPLLPAMMRIDEVSSKPPNGGDIARGTGGDDDDDDDEVKPISDGGGDVFGGGDALRPLDDGDGDRRWVGDDEMAAVVANSAKRGEC